MSAMNSSARSRQMTTLDIFSPRSFSDLIWKIEPEKSRPREALAGMRSHSLNPT
jgi:hypothetical protein